MLFRVLCHRSIASQLSAKLSRHCKVTAFNQYTEESIAKLAGDCDILVSSLATRRVIEAAKKLQFIQCWGVGVNEIDITLASQRGIKVSNMAGVNSAAVADYTLSAILFVTLRLHAFNQANIKSNSQLHVRALRRLFDKDYNLSFPIDERFEHQELAGKVLTIVGFGTIGKQVASRAQAFGMRIIAIKRSPRVSANSSVLFMGSLKDLRGVLGKSDFVSVNLPLTEETRGVFGAGEFSAMKHTAYFINTSRADVVNHQSLLYALKNRLIAGAVLDVVDPTFVRSFSKLSNIILTPHISGDTKEVTSRGIQAAADNINRLVTGQALMNQVSTDKRY